MAGSGGTRRELAEYGAAQERFGALDGWTFHAAIDEARSHLAIAHLPAEARFRELSGGEQARVMLAGVLLARPTILLLDEPTNHLDLGGLRWLEGFLASFPGAALVVSHDRRFLDNTVRRIFELDGVSDQLAAYTGAYTEYRAEKQRRFERLLEEFRAQDRYRRQLEADIARTRGQALHTERTAAGRLGQAEAVREEGREEGQGPRAAAAAADGAGGVDRQPARRRRASRSRSTVSRERAPAGAARARRRRPRRPGDPGRGRPRRQGPRARRDRRRERRRQDDAPQPPRGGARASARPVPSGRLRGRPPAVAPWAPAQPGCARLLPLASRRLRGGRARVPRPLPVRAGPAAPSDRRAEPGRTIRAS